MERIYEIFKQFIDACVKKNFGQIDEIMISSPIIDFSIFTPIYSREALKVKLQESQIYEFKNIKYTNHVCKKNDNFAIQSVYLTGTSYDGIKKDYSFAGAFINKYIYRDDKWMIAEMYFDLKNENAKSDESYARPKWNDLLEDRSVFDGCHLPSISPELDAPWMLFESEEETEQKQISETIYRFLFGIDFDALFLLKDILLVDACVEFDGYLKEKSDEIIRFFKQRNKYIGYASIHPIEIDDMQVEENKALVKTNDLIIKLKKCNQWKISEIKSLQGGK